jgi:hypothetical protein
MYVNKKNETSLNCSRNGEIEGKKEKDGGDELNYDILIYCKNFCKCNNVSQAQLLKK